MQLPKIVAAGVFNSRSLKSSIVTSKNRTVSMFEIELPVEDGGITYIDSHSAPIRTNMIICAKPGQIRHTRFPFKCYYVHIIVPEGILYDILVKTPSIFETDKREICEKLFLSMINHYNSFSEEEDIILYSKLLELIYLISSDVNKLFKKADSKNNNSLIIENTLSYIENNLQDELTLGSISELNYLSPAHFHNIFKAATGRTLREYVEEQRIRKAISLLLSTNLTLTKIAHECGFSSQSYFSYAFKRKMNCTPREYVKNIYSKYEI